MKALFCGLFLVVSAFGQNPLTDSVMTRYKTMRANLIGTAEAMPDDAYNFKLTPEQRSFASWIGHVAMGNHMFCAAIKGEKAPEHTGSHESVNKAELVKAVQDSFAYCDSALAGMTDQKALTAIDASGKQTYPVQGMISLVASMNEHYGNLVGYLRSKGIVPPSSKK